MPKVNRAVSASNIVFPRLNAHKLSGKGAGSYKTFLHEIIAIRSNRAPFAVASKAYVDTEFERQLSETLNNESLVRRYMSDACDSFSDVRIS